MMSVSVETSPQINLGVPKVLFENEYDFDAGGSRQYDLERPKGDRFLMLKPVLRDDPTRLIYIHNWFEELKSLAPTG